MQRRIDIYSNRNVTFPLSESYHDQLKRKLKELVELKPLKIMIMKKTISFLICICMAAAIYSQQGNNGSTAYKFEAGAGLGYEYGGIGLQFSYAPIPNFSGFIGLGVNGGIGYNIGAAWHIIPKTTDHRLRPYLEAMYGYNLVEIVIGDYYHINQYYGPSVGAGIEFRNKKTSRHGFELCFLRYAFWSKAAWDAYYNFDAEERPALGPIGFSIGYHYEF